MSSIATDIELALVSHTNNGKTTLARTLLGIDVGEVRDAAHVTQFSQAHTLLTSENGDRLQLWDTPGFGDSQRLLKRLDNTDNPIGWFLREVLDRYRDRPFWLSQQALRTARDACDVVLYLVNAAERPEDAGYIAAEMKVLAWLGKPVLVLLNQTGPPQPLAQEQAECETWRVALKSYPLVQATLSLDAFARCWVHERVFYQALGALLAQPKAAAHARLLATWETINADRFSEAMTLCARHLGAAAIAHETIVSPEKHSLAKGLLGLSALKRRLMKVRSSDNDQAMQRLVARLERDIAKTTTDLLAVYRLDPGAATQINARVRDDFTLRGPIDQAQAGILGALISGAASGLGADFLSGGMTVGLGALLGGVVGAMTFASAAWGFNTTTGRELPCVQLAQPLLRSLIVASVLRYLAIIHFGRGRGQYVEAQTPAFWQDHVERELLANEQAFVRVWQLLRNDGTVSQGESALEKHFTALTVQVLNALYPGCLKQVS